MADEQDCSLLKLSVTGGIAHIVLNRPSKRNCLNARLIAEINSSIAAMAQKADAIVISGAGEHFCSGLDLSEQKDRTPLETFGISRAWHEAFNQIQFGGLPVIAALHGAVIGGGLELAIAAHVRIAESSAFYSLPEAKRGIFVGGGATARLSKIIGADRMGELMLTGRQIDAVEGQRLGISHQLVEEGGSLRRAFDLARAISSNPAWANYMIMNAIGRIERMSLQDGLWVESMAAAMVQSAQDAPNGIGAFLDKRDADFRNRERAPGKAMLPGMPSARDGQS